MDQPQSIRGPNFGMMQQQPRGPGPYPWGPGGGGGGGNLPPSSMAPNSNVGGQPVDAGGNPLDPYDHLVRQQQQMGGSGPRPFLQMGGNVPRPAMSMANSPIGGGGGPLAAMQQQFSGELGSILFCHA